MSILIITIVILLILAGITISQLSGNGLFAKAKEAKEEWKNSQKDQDNILKDYENLIISAGRTEIQATTENTMSTSEHFIGEYYFNGKPMYEKTIYVESLPNNKSEAYQHGIENLEFAWFNTSKSYWFSKNNPTFTCIFAHVNPNALASTINIENISKSTFSIKTGQDRRTLSAFITLTYTKTTDAATIQTDLPTAFAVEQ